MNVDFLLYRQPLTPFGPWCPLSSPTGPVVAVNRQSQGTWAPGPGPQLLSPARSDSAVREYSCSWPHYHRQHCLCFCLRALNPCSGGPRSSLLPENSVFPTFMGSPSTVCVTVAGKPLNNGRLLYSSGYYRTKTGNVLCEIREEK